MTLDNKIITSYLPMNFSDKPVNVRACTTLVNGGFSTGNYSEYNLATHVGDDLDVVNRNREKLIEDLSLPSEPIWLDQIHSDTVVHVDENTAMKSSNNNLLQGDASVTKIKGIVCAVLTADCLPVFFCNQSGSEVAIAHAGWRGLHAGVISKTIAAMSSSIDEILVSLGPAIGPDAFEVGEEVMQAFVKKDRLNAVAFVKVSDGYYLCDIYKLARVELRSAGVSRVDDSNYCTFSDNNRFYSYRRQEETGRMASLIWLA